jgi:CHAD domain-containing protein
MDSLSSLGDYARETIEHQYHHLIQQEKGVLEDQDPEFLHQMRVGSRRLATALEVFDCAVEMPKPARRKAVVTLAKSLGNLRDLDVQMITLREEYIPRLNQEEQRSIQRLQHHLEEKRTHAFLAVKRMLSEGKYTQLKAAYRQWFARPVYTSLAPLELLPILPDLLNPLLAKLLLHPAWLIPVNDACSTSAITLHSLRKTCKSVRYQAEFFSDFYPVKFKHWIAQIKTLQDDLGKLQDTQVFRKQISTQFSHSTNFPELEIVIQESQNTALANWESTRLQYLDPEFRHSLHEMLLTPLITVNASEI